MALPDAVRAAKLGTHAFEKWQELSEIERVDLSGADLRGVDLRWVNFAGANLEGVKFDGAALTGAYFGPATFRQTAPFVERSDIPVRLNGASFSKSILLASTFNYALVDGATFDGAYLGLANFRQTSFNRVSIKAAQLLNTSFLGCDLGGVVGLDELQHLGPSHIDMGTLAASRNITSRFLRQIGLAPEMADRLLSALPVSPEALRHSCFLSHSTSDKAFCDLLYASLVDEQMQVWYAPEEMRGGELISKQLMSAVHQYDKLLIVLSEHSLKSNWVGNELRWALKREARTDSQVLFPVSLVPFSRLREWDLIDPDTGIDIAARIRSYYIPDFSDWASKGKFDASLARLLKALRR